MNIYYKDENIGTRRVDFFVEGKVMLELKAVIHLEDVHLAQAMNYCQAYGLPIGLLINFGAKSLEYKHLFNKRYEPTKVAEDITPELVGEPSDNLWQLRDYVPAWVIHKMQLDKQKKTNG